MTHERFPNRSGMALDQFRLARADQGIKGAREQGSRLSEQRERVSHASQVPTARPRPASPRLSTTSANPVPDACSLRSEVSDLVHLMCECDDDIAICGADRTGLPFKDDAPEDAVCVVCVDILGPEDICPRCGA